ncbi:hypothetical protein [Enterococcus italicus]|uniref:hypothetical protein n=1 Tax=Enterococcus italicus TaxID=246144 RepID=UPI002072BBAE|nr:hypothetical protein [Enterococcus italicus]
MDFKELKRKKERGSSNEEFMDDAKKFFANADCIIVTGISPSGAIDTLYTQTNSMQAIGMIEIAKQQMIDDLRS